MFHPNLCYQTNSKRKTFFNGELTSILQKARFKILIFLDISSTIQNGGEIKVLKASDRSKSGITGSNTAQVLYRPM
jgi:hypothetical protein